MEEYHRIWLEHHDWRSEEWLRQKLKEGFDIHHIDGDHYNNKIENLVLTESSDHMHLHGMPLRQQARHAPIKSRKKKDYSKKSKMKLDELDYLRERIRKLEIENGRLKEKNLCLSNFLMKQYGWGENTK